MSSGLALGLPAALASAVAIGWGYWVQHAAASGLPPLSPRRPVRSLLALFGNVRWTIGFLTGIGGWVLYVVALRVAPLSLVQAVSAGGLAVLALLAWRVDGSRPRRLALVSLVAAAGGLVLLGASLAGGAPDAGGGGRTSVVLAWVGISAACACLLLAGSRLLRGGAPFGIAAGLLYASGDVATKAATAGGTHVALGGLMLACHGAAFVALQLGFQRGGVLATAGLASLFTNAAPIVAGVAVFGEVLPGGAWGALRVAAFAAVVAGGAGLARTEPPADVADTAHAAPRKAVARAGAT